ncbi:hypothetical protein HPP92_015839 [Vanilla planifolia]|uniref:Uncharacterized protein n=1 Tax=Vanilla planifolia TaxID=51239 RepID=A0A835URI6_VANPL|nr:hypothetical protein HPP92_027239 [Vanilla planifolia]KAG0471293.1 hypothetical protein HPP92_015839 [Vanilla planifolia]
MSLLFISVFSIYNGEQGRDRAASWILLRRITRRSDPRGYRAGFSFFRPGRSDTTTSIQRLSPLVDRIGVRRGGASRGNGRRELRTCVADDLGSICSSSDRSVGRRTVCSGVGRSSVVPAV